MTRFGIVLIGTLIASPVSADSWAPSHGCSEPYKPYQFYDEYEVDRFYREVEDYKECINDFIEEQNDAIQAHSDAAQDALDDWENFVTFNLN